MPRLLSKVARWAGGLAKSGRLPWVAAGLAVLFALPALSAGWIMDDYYHRAVLLGTSQLSPVLGPPSAMFRFFTDDPVRMRRLMDVGLFPWWTDPTLKAEFLQAIPTLTHRLDYVLWPDSPVLMHAHNLFWLGAAVAVAAIYYRRILGPTWVAGVAALLYALDDARGATAGFIANRNVLIAATFGISALIFHDRWRRAGSRSSAILALLFLAAALFSKEEGIGTCAYLAAYALFIDRAGSWRGCLALVPAAATVVVWRTIRSSLGFGVRYVGLYIDPLDEPARFVAALPERIPMLLLGQWTPAHAELAVLSRPVLLSPLWWAALALTLLLLVLMFPLLKRDRLARFWASGMLFALIPVSATFPMDRLLTFPGLGAFGLLALFWRYVWVKAAHASPLWRVPASMLAGFFVIAHVAVGPLLLPYRAAQPIGPGWVEHRLYVRTPLGPAIGDKTLVIVNAPSPVHASYLIFREEQAGRPIPRYTRALAPAVPWVKIRRIDERTLAIRPGRGYLSFLLDAVFRNEQHPLPLGARVELPGMTVEVTALTDDGRPASANFRFDVPLESPTLVWLCFRGTDFVPFTPPAVGEEVEIRFDWRAMLSPVPIPSRSQTGA